MQIPGLSSAPPPTAQVVLRDGAISLRVAAIPFGADEKLRAACPTPLPPLRPVKRPLASGAVKYEFGADGKPLLQPDPTDPEFRKLEAEHNRIYTGFLLWNGLQSDGGISWETPRDLLEKDARAFYLAIHAEIVKTGLTVGEVGEIVKGILRASGTSSERIEAAKRDFTEGASPES